MAWSSETIVLDKGTQFTSDQLNNIGRTVQLNMYRLPPIIRNPIAYHRQDEHSSKAQWKVTCRSINV